MVKGGGGLPLPSAASPDCCRAARVRAARAVRGYDAGGWATGPTAYDEITRDAMSAAVEVSWRFPAFPVVGRVVEPVSSLHNVTTDVLVVLLVL